MSETSEGQRLNEAGGARLLTFGCRLNAYESEVIRGHAEAAGLGPVVIVNTCAVTAEATRQARQAIRKARRDNPTARILVTGCAAQIDPDSFAAMPEVDHVLGNAEKLKAETFRALARHDAARVAVADIMTVRETASHLIAGFEGRARAFVEVQQGCDHRCTFCIIPFGRGPSRSVPADEIVRQIRALIENGSAEAVLTGVNLTAYGADLTGAPTLSHLARRVLAEVPELARLRLSSLDPVDVDEDLLRLVAEEPRLMPHLHLSLQAGDDLILKRMKRRHTRQQAVELSRRLRGLRPDLALGADLIAGFPTETEEAFQHTLELIADCGLNFLHVFPYSARAGTPAARMPQVPAPLRRERARRLRDAGGIARRHFFESRLDSLAAVLVEKADGAHAQGHSEHFAPVTLDRPAAPGSIVQATIEGIGADGLIGRLAA
jgi:threonylcarbamoyladenosine tRNA methylthiotransferase MtaB